MKRYFPSLMILIAVSFCIGFSFKLYLMQNGEVMSIGEREMNECIQDISAVPLFIGGGLIFLLAPLSLEKWLASFLGGRPSMDIIQVLIMRALGLITIFAGIYSWIYNYNCQGWLQNLFR